MRLSCLCYLGLFAALALSPSHPTYAQQKALGKSLGPPATSVDFVVHPRGQVRELQNDLPKAHLLNIPHPVASIWVRDHVQEPFLVPPKQRLHIEIASLLGNKAGGKAREEAPLRNVSRPSTSNWVPDNRSEPMLIFPSIALVKGNVK